VPADFDSQRLDDAGRIQGFNELVPADFDSQRLDDRLATFISSDVDCISLVNSSCREAVIFESSQISKYFYLEKR